MRSGIEDLGESRISCFLLPWVLIPGADVSDAERRLRGSRSVRAPAAEGEPQPVGGVCVPCSPCSFM